MTKRDLAGQMFGKWTVIGPSAKPRHWDCHCACGTDRAVYGPNLTRGLSPSCGCVSGERARATCTRHGHKAAGVTTPEYAAWCNLRARCERPSAAQFKNYGGRGIYVCQRWRESFDAFLRDVGFRPGATHSIDRINTDGSYTCGACAQCVERVAPMNVQWAPPKAQARNRRSNVFVEHDGHRLTIAEWAERTGIPPQLIAQRIRANWPADLALSPVRQRPNAVAHRSGA